MRFAEMTSTEIGDAARRNALVIVPIGQTEEHGPHLPTGADAMIGDEVARRIEEALQDEMPVVVMDTIRYGYSVKAVAEFPGTIRLSPDTVANVMLELCKSLCEMGFRKIAIVNTHGNHPGILRMVSRRLGDDCDLDVPVLEAGPLGAEALAKCAEGGEGASCHSGEMETSMVLRLRPDLVKTDRYPTEDRVRVKNPCSGAVFWSTWWRQKSASGAYGDPATASAEKGETLFEGITQKACEFLRTYYAHQRS